MSARAFTYDIAFEDGRTLSFTVDTDATMDRRAHRAEWTRLDNHQCPNCPLSPEDWPHCPAAVDVAPVVEAFAASRSVDRVEVRVSSARRTVVAETDVQTCLRSLLGLIMPTSGCPVLGQLHGLARYHQPFSDHEETVFRVVGAYLIEQYLAAQSGEEADWSLDGVRDLYEDLQKVDIAFVDRIREASPTDASLNAVVALFSLASLVSLSLDQEMRRIRDRLLGPSL